MSRKEEFIKGLRDLADWLEQQDTDLRLRQRTWDFLYYNSDEANIAKAVKLLGHCEKFETPDTIGVRRKFGPITLQFRWPRHQMCKRVKVGERKLDGQFEYVYVKKPIVEPEYEWKCPKSFIAACCEDK